jgi:cytochrome P450
MDAVRDNVLNPKKERMSDEEATSHLRTLLFAATDTTSSAILRTLLVLSRHPSIQSRLRDEINEARESAGGDLEYDTIMSLPLLNAVFLETMRLYPPASYVDRVALEDLVLPLAYPITGIDGTPVSQVHVQKGTVITLSLIGVNKHKGVWGDDAPEWKPDRWLSEDGEKVTAVKDERMPGISSHVMTFMDGKRHCLCVPLSLFFSLILLLMMCVQGMEICAAGIEDCHFRVDQVVQVRSSGRSG